MVTFVSHCMLLRFYPYEFQNGTWDKSTVEKIQFSRHSGNFIFSFIAEMLGYVTSVSPRKMSGCHNPYFDIDLKVSPTFSNKVRVMETKTTTRALFMSKKENKSPVKLYNLSPSQTGITFFNSSVGSRLQDGDEVSFQFVEENLVKINDISVEQGDSSFDVQANIKWVSDARTVAVGEHQIPRQVRDGILADDTGTINVFFWGQDLIEQIKENTTYKITKLVTVSNFGIKLTSTANTICQESESKLKIDWDKLNCQDLNQVICSPEIMSAKLTKYLVCVNIDCKKKVTPFQGDITVTCTNSTCRRKMLVQRCKESFSLEITLQEPSGKQHNVTVFPKTLESFYQKKNKIIQIDELEDEMLEFNFLDFTVNRRKIVIKMEDHLETLVDDRLEQVPEFTVSQQQKEL